MSSSKPDPVERDSRGILDPWLLRQRVQLTRYPAGPALDGLVDRFWAVRWDLPPGTVHQPAGAHPPRRERQHRPRQRGAGPARAGTGRSAPVRGGPRPVHPGAGRPGLDRRRPDLARGTRGVHHRISGGAHRPGRPPGAGPRHRRGGAAAAGDRRTGRGRPRRAAGRRAGAGGRPGAQGTRPQRRRGGPARRERPDGAAARRPVRARLASASGPCSGCSCSTQACHPPG